MNAFLTLLRKDIALEVRSKESIVVMLCLSLLLAVVAAIGTTLAFLPPDTISRIVPVLIWMIFVFSATSALGRSMEHEVEMRALDAVILSGVSPAAMYCSKVLANSAVVCFGHMSALVLLTVLLDLPILSHWGALFLISLVVVIGYSSLATLFAAMTSSARLRGLLLPLVLLPLLFPLLFGAIEQTVVLIVDGVLDPSSFWFSFLCFLDLLYLVLGLNLYGFVIRE